MPLFHAKDVCVCIGLTTAGGKSQHLTALDADERSRVSKRTLANSQGHGAAQAFVGSTGSANAVTESGLYKLILRANPSRPEVAKFQNWVTRDVLPSIRMTGGYQLHEEAHPTSHADAMQPFRHNQPINPPSR
ncbi:hypothetical protein HHL27_01635 [Novosphingobium sp. TW-4]|uniref:Bro-N domain-containing protein n=1 Tax=Novosphingobium olei TaxID=2728851 RepID=A0A7Y0BL57_9SPHN|nr:hypothetical protein [Novosphingobium olei]